MGGNPLKWIDFLGLTAECPSAPPFSDDPDWVPYHGNSSWFHCGYTGYHENRDPTPDDPVAECFYDENDVIVDECHEYSNCSGTPNQYPSDDWWNHGIEDSGGIYENGWDSFLESIDHWWDK